MAQADFLWNATSGEVLRRSGDLVASGVTTAASLTGVVEKWRAVQALAPFVSELNTRLIVAPDGGDVIYREHRKIALDIDRTERGKRAGRLYATVFNLASDGTVQMLYPLAPDGDGIVRDEGQTLVLETEVAPPFGTDHVVALTTPTAPTQLRAVARTLDGTRAADALLEPIRKTLIQAKGAGSLSISEIYTDR